MRSLLLSIIKFLVIGLILLEAIVRLWHLVPEIPERIYQENGIQKYKPNQTGYFPGNPEAWEVNEAGWLGINDTINPIRISIIGDSFIENMMNPRACNQASQLKILLPEISFFEAAHSGMNYIESLLVAQEIKTQIKPKFQLIYLREFEIFESLAELDPYQGNTHVDLLSGQIIPGKPQYPLVKKLIYQLKSISFLVKKYITPRLGQNRINGINQKNKFKQKSWALAEKLLEYSKENYDMNDFIFVFHPNTSPQILQLFEKNKIAYMLLSKNRNEDWDYSSTDKHWSCYAHGQVAKQVSKIIAAHLASKQLN